MFEFEDPRLIRWLALFASLAIEAPPFGSADRAAIPTKGFRLEPRDEGRERGGVDFGLDGCRSR